MRISLLKTLGLLSLCLLFGITITAQNVDYTMNVQQLRWNDSDNGDQSGGRDPRWKIWGYDNDGSGTQGGVCQSQDDIASAPYNWNVSDYSVLSRTNTAATTIQVQLKAWEDDCGESCDFEGSCGAFGALEDDDHASQGNAGAAISFRNDPPCQWNTYGWLDRTSDSRWGVEVGIYWQYVSLTPGAISSNQTICSGGDPTQISGDGNESAHVEYQWQYSTGCTGTWTDIPGATSADYDPPSGLTATTCYRRRVRIACDTGIDNYSNTITVTVETLSTAPSSITASATTLCGSGTVDLTVNGGSLGTGATWEWYNGDPTGGGTPIGSGAMLSSYSVSSTMTIYVRAEGSCNNTSTVSTTITVGTPNTDPTGVTASSTTICNGSTVDLTVQGGALGTGGNWVWYNTDPSSGSPASIYSSTSSSYNGVAPTSSTTYYVRAEGCDTTIVQSISVTVQTLSTDPSSITASATTICVGGGPVNLSVVGGSLGTGASWQWYDAGCGSSNVGSGTSLAVNPTVTTTYYVRAEGTCNNSNCASVTITVNQESTDPTGILTANTNLCLGQTAVLNVSGGSLGAGATWEWYEASCGGSSIGSGNAISVSPTATTTYFVRAEGTCNTTNCATTTITIGNGAADPDSATVSMNNICPEDTVTLTVWSSTSLPSGYVYVWYTSACGAVPVGVGQTLDVSPSSTTTYYVKAVGTCGESLCASVSVTVLPGSVTPDGILTDNNNFCIGGSAILTVDGGSLESGASWTWYENSCGGSTPIGTGSSITVTPTSTTTYYVRGEGGTCGNTQCATISINVHGAQVYLVPFDTVCVDGNTAFNLTGGLPTGGTYSGTAVSSGVFNASTAGVGTHAITYTYTDGFGCSNSATENIVVADASTAASSITADNNVVCNSGTATLTVNGGNLVSGADWYWYENSCGGGTSIGTGTSIMVSPTQTTTYFVRAEGGNDYCGFTECVAITISVSNPSANLLPFDPVCEASTVTLTGGIPSGGSYSGTGVSGNSFDASAAGTGTHTITYTYTDGNGCSATAMENITVVDGGVSATVSTEVETCANGGVLVHVAASGGTGNYTYLWSDGTTQNPHMWTEPGTYTVTVGDGSGCATVADSIVIDDDLSSPCLELANTFTPNGDGTNDTWNLDFSSYNTAKLEVYSRWGLLVYQTDGLVIQWDGNDLSGNALPSGTYYYVIDIDSGTMTQNGPISIVR